MAQELAARLAQETGGPVEDFTLVSIRNVAINLKTLLQGTRGALVVFWSSVCSHCMRYDSYLNSFRRQHPELQLAVVASREGETPDQLRASVSARQLKFDILHDPGGRVAWRWFVQQTPRVFLVDAAGILQYRGAIDNYKYAEDPDHVAYIEPAIDEFLSGRPLSRTETASFGCAIQSVYYRFPKAL